MRLASEPVRSDTSIDCFGYLQPCKGAKEEPSGFGKWRVMARLKFLVREFL